MALFKRKYIFLSIIGFLGILLTWIIYFFRGPQRWDSLDITHMGYFNGWDLTASDQGYGQVTFGPGLTLQSGRYTIEWEIDTDADNIVYLTTDNDANLSPSSFTVHAGEHCGECTFTLLEPSDNLQILIFFESGNILNVGTISLCGPRRSDRAWLITLVLLAFSIISFLAAINKLKKTDILRITVIISVAALASLPAFRLSISLGHDGSVHIMRLQALVSALLQKQFPVRVSGSLFNGYGSLFAVFYPPLILYPAALMVCCHSSLQFAFQSTIIGLTLLSGIGMYNAGRKLFNNPTAGMISSILYLSAPYRLSDVFTRVALGEVAAMAFLPLFFLELYECLYDNKQRWPHLALYAALLVNTHLITALFCAILCLVICIFLFPKLLRENRIRPVILALLLAFGLSISSLMPMFTYYRQGIDVSNMLTSMSENTLSIGNLLGIAAVNPYYWEPSSRSVGLLLLFSNLLLIVFSIHTNGRKHFKIAFSFFIISIIFCFMTTHFFPWKQISQITHNVIDIFQFPYRLLTYVDVFLSFSGGYALSLLVNWISSPKNKVSAAITCTFLIIITVASIIQIRSIYIRTWSDQKQYSRNNTYLNLFVPPDYLLTGTSVDSLISKTPQPDEGLLVNSFDKFGTHISCIVNATSDAALTLPLFGFSGYSAEINGISIPVTVGNNNQATVFINSGTQGKLSVSFSGKPIWHITDLLSLACLLFFMHFALNKNHTNILLSPVHQVKNTSC